MSAIHPAKVANYAAALHALSTDDRLRGLKPRAGIDFVSNDYLAFASAPRIRKAVVAALEAGTPLGAGGSRLLRGNCEAHERLEAEAAIFFRAETALFFGGGYVANFAVLTTLPQRSDLLVLDSLVHASIHEGARSGSVNTMIPSRLKTPFAIGAPWAERGGPGSWSKASTAWTAIPLRSTTSLRSPSGTMRS
jgi:8-amino-7-oxononanoate synthase